MQKRVAFLVIALMLTGGAIAQEKRMTSATQDQPKEATWHGYLVDAKSAKEMAKDPESAMQRAAEYAAATAITNEIHGYGIFVEGKWLPFEATANKKVIEFLKTTKLAKGIHVAVTGNMAGENIAVTSIRQSEKTLPHQVN